MKNRLKALRLERKWTQAQLAALLGVSRQTVNALERGKYDPGLPLAFRIARLFVARIEEVFTPDEVEPAWTQPALPEAIHHALGEAFTMDPVTGGSIGQPAMPETVTLSIGEMFDTDSTSPPILIPPGAPDPAILN